MKSIYKLLLMLTLVFSISSCEDLSEDPDTFSAANDRELLTGAQGYLAYIVDVDLNMGSFLWAQYYTWGIGVSLGNAERFVAQPNDFDGYWERAYSKSLIDLKTLSNSELAPYRGIAKALQAYIFQGLVDHFGPIPYTDALSGEIEEGYILTPSYDEASVVYDSLINKIDEALVDLYAAQAMQEEMSAADFNEIIGANDLVYQGDMSKWIRFANSLKLRILMRTSETDPKAAEVQALIQDGIFIEDVNDIASIEVSGETGNQNPMYARMEWGVGDFYFASNATLDLLESLDDPRATAFYDLATTGTFKGNLNGIDQGTIDEEPFTAPSSDYSGSSDYAYSVDNPVILMSPWEVWFLRAEADARYGTADDEEAAFAKGIITNFNYIEVEGADDYIASLGYDAAAALIDRIDQIAVQKFISLNGTQEDEGWIEARRFDRPESRLFTGEGGIWQVPPQSVLSGRTFPSAWLYPATERGLNPNAPAQRTLTDNIFWDN